jgi:bifunctional UDP-N-acetylglucosamine pyrophosphorylase/glucosamine-1-phosphate N-acetyltransferase
VLQDPPSGTGHAVLCARQALEGVTGTLLVLNGDTPLVPPELLAELLAEHERKGAAVSVVSTLLDEPGGYGRMVRDEQGELAAITEAADATPDELEITEVNAGVWALSLPAAWDLLAGVGRDNAQGEVYLTDLVATARAAGLTVGSLCWDDPEDLLGFNDHLDLALVRAVLRERILTGHLSRGVEVVDPETTYIDATVDIAPGARVLPCTMIEGRTRLATGSEAGPFAHLRDGTVLEAGAEIGNFTETKQTTVGAHSKAKHLTYLGDTVVGARTNIGAGTITANYDGKHKHPTRIGDDAFIGSGTVLVAPADVADGGVTGAGAVVTRSSAIGPGETWVGVPARKLRTKGDP